MKKEIIFEDIVVFEKSTCENWSDVIVKNKDEEGYIHNSYRFKNTKVSYESPYISWENLNQCNGWQASENYIKTAVQTGKKICALIVVNTHEELQDYINGLPDECGLYWEKHNLHFYRFWIYRKGCLLDFYDIEKVLGLYNEHGFHFRTDVIHKYASMQIEDIVKSLLNVNPMEVFLEVEEFVIKGLMYGYPIESTVSLLHE